MTFTNFPKGVSSFGMPLLGGAGTLPLMGASGKVYFVDPANGSDSNSGKSPSAALDTITAAYNKCVDKAGDTIYLLNDGNTTGSAREATLPLTWEKDNVHLVGLCAPAVVSQRSRITPVSTAALTANAVIDVTGSGNVFANVQIGHFGADTDSIAARGVDVSGSRNYFYNVHIVGIPNAHTGDEAAACDLLIDGGQENVFERCALGVDTVTRTAANSVVKFTTAATRNLFKDCILAMITDAADPLFVDASASGALDRWTIFKDCLFLNAVESTSTAITAAISHHNTSGGMIVLDKTMIVGATDVAAADNGNVYSTPIDAAATGSLATVLTR